MPGTVAAAGGAAGNARQPEAAGRSACHVRPPPVCRQGQEETPAHRRTESLAPHVGGLPGAPPEPGRPASGWQAAFMRLHSSEEVTALKAAARGRRSAEGRGATACRYRSSERDRPGWARVTPQARLWRDGGSADRSGCSGKGAEGGGSPGPARRAPGISPGTDTLSPQAPPRTRPSQAQPLCQVARDLTDGPGNPMSRVCWTGSDIGAPRQKDTPAPRAPDSARRQRPPRPVRSQLRPPAFRTMHRPRRSQETPRRRS